MVAWKFNFYRKSCENVHIQMHIFTLLRASVVDCVSVVDCEGNLHFMGSIVRRLLGVGGKEPIVLNRGVLASDTN